LKNLGQVTETGATRTRPQDRSFNDKGSGETKIHHAPKLGPPRETEG